MQEFKKKKKKKHGSGTTTLKISDEEVNDIMKIVQAFEGFNILLKGVTKTIKNETKRRIFKHFIRYSRRKFVRKFIIRKGNVRAGSRNKKGKGIVRAVYGNKMNF